VHADAGKTRKIPVGSPQFPNFVQPTQGGYPGVMNLSADNTSGFNNIAILLPVALRFIQQYKTGLPEMMPVQALTADAIYREYDQDLNYAREKGCDIVNCDSSHLFAVSREVGNKSTECGVISDVVTGDGEEWQSDLSMMLSSNDEGEQDPLVSVGKIAEFYVEVLMPELLPG